MQAAGRRQGFLVQGKNNRYPQICSFTACGGGVSGVSLVRNVGVCEAASQCGDGKGSVLPVGEVLLCLLAFCLSKSQEIAFVCMCVCAREMS